MPGGKRHVIFTYVLLVGAPLLGLAAILAGGRQMRAPALVAGAWNIECATAAGAKCSLVPRAVTIAQAGPRVDITAGGRHPVAVGLIEGATLRLRLTGAAQPCPQEMALRISGPPRRRSLEGRGFAPDGSGCADVRVRGVQTSARRGP
jgi:hypothetical protein